ncbi:MAG: hypothetical protein JSR24_11385 [Proteobacteria bacterium]|nr:hypothetical protein [Pseudomonadota bacterium]
MNRRDFLFGGLALAGLSGQALAATPNVHIVYVGGWDCPYCTTWKNQYKAAWVASPEFAHVRWTEVDVPHLRDAYRPQYWQGDLAPILEQLPRKSGTPRFLVVRDGKVVSNEFGVSKWENSVVVIRSLLG